ncbi:MAG: hypothetical protein ACI90V_012487, partial [Bacillariaceae sp.]
KSTKMIHDIEQNYSKIQRTLFIVRAYCILPINQSTQISSKTGKWQFLY